MPKEAGTWIGLYKGRRAAEDTCSYWLDLNPSGYRNWKKGEPDTNNTCVRMTRKGLYRDRPCHKLHHYVCKGIPLTAQEHTLYQIHQTPSMCTTSIAWVGTGMAT